MARHTCEGPVVETTADESFILSESDMERMLRGLKEGDPVGRSAVRSAVRGLGAAALPALACCMDSTDVILRRRAAGLLRDLPADRRAVATLARGVGDEDWLVRLWCLDALGRLGQCAGAASGAIKGALDDPMPLVRAAAFVARWKLNGVG